MGNNIKRIVAALLIATMVFATTGCGKDKEKDLVDKLTKEDNSTVEKEETQPVEESKATGAISPGELDDRVNFETARIMAESNDVDFSREILQKYYDAAFKSLNKPTSLRELVYNSQSIEQVCTMDGILNRIAVEYVEDILRQREKDRLNNLPEEDIDAIVARYKAQMNNLGIVESAQREYALEMEKEYNVESVIQEKYQEAYLQAIKNIFTELAPDYLNSLNLSK